ncbi:energy transducer TonB [Castellaniella caeni]|uniref:energy transducer TonB n=1 Tax=Castellaniella caeni TaxID=266123 RepID=UPI000A03AD6E|nr:TonB family protein [Castellaniella caeni]
MTQPTADPLPLQLLQAPREGRSRMATALLISACLHGLLLLWQGVSPPAPAPLPTLDITLVNSRSDQAPLQAQALAQNNLDGGGEQAAGLAASPLPRTSADSADETVLEALRRRQAELEAEQRQLLAQLEAHDQVAASRPSPQLLGQSADPGEDDRQQESLVLSARIAALKERIERYNAQPRQTFVAPATRAVDYAAYVEAWRRRIELIGTEHYPPEARGKIYGELQLTVYIRRDGQLDHLEFDRPSSHAVLNSAARRIVELAAPFPPLPTQLARQTDVLAITRTWHFTRGGLSTETP